VPIGRQIVLETEESDLRQIVSLADDRFDNFPVHHPRTESDASTLLQSASPVVPSPKCCARHRSASLVSRQDLETKMVNHRPREHRVTVMPSAANWRQFDARRTKDARGDVNILVQNPVSLSATAGSTHWDHVHAIARSAGRPFSVKSVCERLKEVPFIRGCVYS
jgi:hypothetical protein